MRKGLRNLLAVATIFCLLLSGCAQKEEAEFVPQVETGETYRDRQQEEIAPDLKENPREILEALGMKNPEQWVVKMTASVDTRSDAGENDTVTLRFSESASTGALCTAGYVEGQWVRGVIEKATQDYIDVRFAATPSLVTIFSKSTGTTFLSPNGGVQDGERILEVDDWPFELEEDYWCEVSQEYSSEADRVAAEKLLEDPEAHIAEFVPDASLWKLALLVDVRLSGNLDSYDGGPVTVAFPEIRADQQICVLHFVDGQWRQEADKFVVDDYIGVRFTSFSPVAFFVKQGN